MPLCLCVCWNLCAFMHLTLALVHVPQTRLLSTHISTRFLKGHCANMPAAIGHVLQKKPSLACDSCGEGVIGDRHGLFACHNREVGT